MNARLTVLGIESSCDETAAAIVQYSSDDQLPRILSSIVFSQYELHASFGGVVPEIAARAHTDLLDRSTAKALQESGMTLDDIDAVAVTAGPGLIGGVLSGVMFAKGLSLGKGIPLIGVNHLAGHALTPRLTHLTKFPYLMLLVSGGHCQFLIVRGIESYDRLGGTIDDSPGEAFDKTARLLGLAQPGGPAVEACAQGGNSNAVKLPRPLLDRPDCNMSFSGLKTAVLRERDKAVALSGGLSTHVQADLSAAFQTAVTDVLSAKTRIAMRAYMQIQPDVPVLAVSGGVAANNQIRAALETVSNEFGAEFLAPPLALCTDNAAMIAWVGLEKLQLGLVDDLSLSARPRWPLDTKSTPMLGAGKKGAKA